MMAPMTVHDGSAALLDHVEPATVMAGAPFQAFKPRLSAAYFVDLTTTQKGGISGGPDEGLFVTVWPPSPRFPFAY
jgi:hypothetical protein